MTYKYRKLSPSGQWQTHTCLLKYTLGMALHYPHCSPSSEVRKPKQKWVVPGHILNRNTHSSQRELGPSEFKTLLFLFPRSHVLYWLFIPSFPLQNCLSPPSSPSTISSLALLPNRSDVFSMFSSCSACTGPFTLTMLQLGSSYDLAPLSAPRYDSPHCYLQVFQFLHTLILSEKGFFQIKHLLFICIQHSSLDP